MKSIQYILSIILCIILDFSVSLTIQEEKIRQCQIANCETCSSGGNSCEICAINFFLSSDISQCLLCPTNCLKCEHNSCLHCMEGFILKSKQCISAAPNQSRSLMMQHQQKCHYTCQTCNKNDSPNNCLSCPQTRQLHNYAELQFGRCLCQEDSADTGNYECSTKTLSIDSLNSWSYMMEGIFIPGMLLSSAVGGDASFLYLLLETMQSYNILLYVNSQNTGNFDNLFESLTFSHLDKYLPSIVTKVYYFMKNPNEQICVGNPKFLQDSYNADNILVAAYMYIFITSLLWIARYTLKYIDNSFSSQSDQIQRWKDFLNCNLIVLYFTFTFQSISLQVIFSLYCAYFSSILSTTGFLTALVIIIYLLVGASLVSYAYFKGIHKEKYNYLFNIFEMTNKLQLSYLPMIFTKKFLAAIFLITLHSSPVSQSLLLLLLQIISSVYLLYARPLIFFNKFQRFRTLFISVSIQSFFYFLIFIKQVSPLSFTLDFLLAFLMLFHILGVGIQGVILSFFSLRQFLVYKLMEEKPEAIENSNQLRNSQPQKILEQSNMIEMFEKSSVAESKPKFEIFIH